MNPYKFAAVLIPTGLVGFVVAAFAIQNSSRATELSLNLGVWGGQSPLVQIPVLMAICVGAGFLLGLIVPAIWRMRSGASSSDSYGDADTSYG
jgi:hypothetical protein